MSLIDRVIVPLKNRVRYTPFLRALATCLMADMDFPAVIGVDPTNICNLRCTFCGPITMREKKGVMDLALYRRLLDECRARRKLWMLVLHNFGEPLMHPAIAEMVVLAKRQRVARSVNFSTNGTRLTRAMARALILAGLDGLVISVDAYSREEYLELKGRDCLGRIEENAREIMALKKDLGRENPHVSAKMVRRRGYEQTFSPFLKKWASLVDEAALTPYSNWGDRVADNGTETVPAKRFACHFLWYYPAVCWDGRVFFCCAACDREAVVGDLNRATMAEIWTGEKLREIRKAHLEGRFDRIPSCRNCTYWAESRVNLDRFFHHKQRKAGRES